jgi:hypothetical protein
MQQFFPVLSCLSSPSTELGWQGCPYGGDKEKGGWEKPTMLVLGSFAPDQLDWVMGKVSDGVEDEGLRLWVPK